MLASQLIVDLQALVEQHGDRDVRHEDNECNANTLSDVIYDKQDDDFKID